MILIEQQLLPEADNGYIYFAEMTIDGDKFLKVGYSRNPLKRFDTDEFDEVDAHVRFINIVPMQEWMYDFADFTPSNDYWELALHKVMQNTVGSYQPEHDFSGKTECYLLDTVNYKAAIDYLEEQLSFMAPPKDWYIPYSLD
ncbi:hypothetical protein [Aeromonas veronii]|uniref:hypothetical protein n=1 Tax=Aeromonas veronii TaxID=654 RepID=UPI003670713D